LCCDRKENSEANINTFSDPFNSKMLGNIKTGEFCNRRIKLREIRKFSSDLRFLVCQSFPSTEVGLSQKYWKIGIGGFWGKEGTCWE
jgi:hypothetical protein